MAGDDARKLRVLLVDDDPDLSEVVTAVLGAEGYEVLTPQGANPDQVQRAIDRHEPDCILLDSAGRTDYGASWESAALIRQRKRRVPVVMFTAHAGDSDEAEDGTSDRAQAAGFIAVLRKPFGLDELLETVARAVAASVP